MFDIKINVARRAGEQTGRQGLRQDGIHVSKILIEIRLKEQNGTEMKNNEKIGEKTSSKKDAKIRAGWGWKDLC